MLVAGTSGRPTVARHERAGNDSKRPAISGAAFDAYRSRAGLAKRLAADRINPGDGALLFGYAGGGALRDPLRLAYAGTAFHFCRGCDFRFMGKRSAPLA